MSNKQTIHFYFLPSIEKKFPSGVKEIKTWIVKVLDSLMKKKYTISFIFTDDKFLLNINKKYLRHDYFTDIITFDLTEKPASVLEAEIYISIERVAENAEKFKTGFTIEIKRVMVHGLLHLMGYKDHTKKEKTEMRKKENELLGWKMLS